MTMYVPRSLATAAAVAALASAATAPAAGAATAGQTLKVAAARADVDNKAPGPVVSGTIFKGNRFKLQRVARVTHGSVKGLWYLGTATVKGEHAKSSKGEVRPFQSSGWVKASAFS